MSSPVTTSAQHSPRFIPILSDEQPMMKQQHLINKDEEYTINGQQEKELEIRLQVHDEEPIDQLSTLSTPLKLDHLCNVLIGIDMEESPKSGCDSISSSNGEPVIYPLFNGDVNTNENLSRRNTRPFLPIMIDGIAVLKPRGSLASRRSSAAVKQNQLQNDRPSRPSLTTRTIETCAVSLQPPKLDTLSIQPDAHSPVSPSEFPKFNVPHYEALLDTQALPVWLQDLVTLPMDQAYFYLRNQFKKIEEAEADRIHRSPSHYNFTFKAAHLKENEKKNRYPDITPFDHNRVCLSTGRGDDDDDTAGSNYINASWIKGYKNSDQYIVCQGPLPHTTGNFWQMVWEQQSNIIVMLTLEEEKGRVKCHSYWPKTIKDEVIVEHLGLKIKFIDEELVLKDEMIIQQLHIIHADSGKSRIVHHVHFVAWPDHRVGYPKSILSTIAFVKRLQKNSTLINDKLDNNNTNDNKDSVHQNHVSNGTTVSASETNTSYNSSFSFNTKNNTLSTTIASRNISEPSLNRQVSTAEQHQKRLETKTVLSIPSLTTNDDSILSTTSTEIQNHVIKKIKHSNIPSSSTPPLVVHCSAGCGRAGTFVALDTLLKNLETQREIPQDLDLIFLIVDYLREQRVSMVQTLEQYIFCYEVLIQWFSDLISSGRMLPWQLYQQLQQQKNVPLTRSVSKGGGVDRVVEDHDMPPPSPTINEKKFEFF